MVQVKPSTYQPVNMNILGKKEIYI